MKKIIISIILVIFTISLAKATYGLFDGNITTKSITNVTNNSAQSGGIIDLFADDPDVTQKGIMWSTSHNPTTISHLGMTNEGANPTMGNSLSYTSNMTGLQLNTTYYVRAYFINSDGTTYGQEVAFTTIPTLGEWGAIAMISLIAVFGIWVIRKRVI